MTVIIGLRCKDAIVVASDSQSTCGNVKSLDTAKIVHVYFSDMHEALIAQSGNADTSGRAIEIIEELLTNAPLNNQRALADVAEKAMRKVKEEMRAQQLDCSMEDLQKYIWNNELDCGLLLAYYYGGKQCIYEISLYIGMASPRNSQFVTMGCGGNVAHALLSQLLLSDLDQYYGVARCVYVVDRVKEADAFCGGDTKVGVISPTIASILNQKTVNKLSLACSKMHEKAKLSWNENLKEMWHQVRQVIDTQKSSGPLK